MTILIQVVIYRLKLRYIMMTTMNIAMVPSIDWYFSPKVWYFRPILTDKLKRHLHLRVSLSNQSLALLSLNTKHNNMRMNTRAQPWPNSSVARQWDRMCVFSMRFDSKYISFQSNISSPTRTNKTIKSMPISCRYLGYLKFTTLDILRTPVFYVIHSPVNGN